MRSLAKQKESFAKFVLFIEVFLVKNLFPPLYLLLLHLPPFISKCNSPHRDASHLGHHRKLFQILVLEAAAPFYEDTRRIFFSGSRYIQCLKSSVPKQNLNANIVTSKSKDDLFWIFGSAYFQRKVAQEFFWFGRTRFKIQQDGNIQKFRVKWFASTDNWTFKSQLLLWHFCQFQVKYLILFLLASTIHQEKEKRGKKKCLTSDYNHVFMLCYKQ